MDCTCGVKLLIGRMLVDGREVEVVCVKLGSEDKCGVADGAAWTDMSDSEGLETPVGFGSE